MNHVIKTPAWAEKSPWLDTSKTNLFRDEFQIAEEKLDRSSFTPIEPYRWIYENKGQELFFKGLAQFAPMFKLIGYNGEVTVWASPPPSGFGNAIYMVMGHDSKGELRLVGGNYFSEPSTQSVTSAMPNDFFGQYDKANKYEQMRLVRETVEGSFSSSDIPFLLDIRRECEHIHVMGIYITVLTANGVLSHAAKAVIEGNKPVDFSYEIFGEII